MEGKGVWVDGRLSRAELFELRMLVSAACSRYGEGVLPFECKSEKISFKAWAQDGALVVSYGWNYPPQGRWVKGIRGLEECAKCWPRGVNKEPGREVWCSKLDFNFPRCPYGVVVSLGIRR